MDCGSLSRRISIFFPSHRMTVAKRNQDTTSAPLFGWNKLFLFSVLFLASLLRITARMWSSTEMFQGCHCAVFISPHVQCTKGRSTTFTAWRRLRATVKHGCLLCRSWETFLSGARNITLSSWTPGRVWQDEGSKKLNTNGLCMNLVEMLTFLFCHKRGLAVWENETIESRG